MQKHSVLSASIFILVCLSPSGVVAAPTFAHPRQVPPAPPVPGAPLPTTNDASTWTYNYWWPYPPASTDTVPTPIATAAPRVGAAPGQGTFLLPVPEPSPAPIPDGNEDINSLISASVYSTIPTSSSALSNSPSATTSSITNSSSDQGNSDDKKRRKSNILYLILFFSIWGFLSLAGASWLIYGCCTRKSKHPSSRFRPYSSLRVAEGCGRGYDQERKGILIKSNEANAGTFRAFRYEDLTAKPVSQHSFEADLEVSRKATEVVCDHVKEYGFECDCRPPVIESRAGRFGWPRAQLEDIPIDDDDGRVCGDNEDGDLGRPKSRSLRTHAGTGEHLAAVFSPLEILSDSCSEPEFTPASDGTERGGMQSGYFSTKEGEGRRGKILEGIWSQSREREGVSLQRAVKATRKGRGTVRSAKSVKSTKTSRTAWTERSIYSGDGDDDDDIERDEGGGFRMIAERPPISEDTARSFKVDLSSRRELSGGDESEGWVGKVTNAIGSSLSRLSGNQDDDRYTSLPHPPDYTNLSPSSQHRRSQARRARRIGEQAYPPGHPRFGSSAQAPQSSQRHAVPRLRGDKAVPESRTEDHFLEMTEEEITEQRKRLQSHRASLASLPAGMVYSPPLVGVSVFGEESRGRPGASVSPSNVKEVDDAVAEGLEGKDDGGRRRFRGKALPRYPQ